MACLITELCLLVLGIITLVTGKINVSKDKMIVGAPARWIGAVLLLPLPLAFLVGFVWGMMIAAQGRMPDPKELRTIGAVIEIGIFGLCMVVCLIIALSSQKVPVTKVNVRRREPDYDDEEDRRNDRGRRPSRYEDEYDDRPRRSPSAGYEDEEPRRSPVARDAFRAENEPADIVMPEPVSAPPSPIKIECTSCHGTIGIPDTALGKSVKCPLCSAVFVAQKAPPLVPPPPAPPPLPAVAPATARVQCSHCKKDLSVPGSAIGKSVKCPLCSGIFTAQPVADTGYTR